MKTFYHGDGYLTLNILKTIELYCQWVNCVVRELSLKVLKISVMPRVRNLAAQVNCLLSVECCREKLRVRIKFWEILLLGHWSKEWERSFREESRSIVEFLSTAIVRSRKKQKRLNRAVHTSRGNDQARSLGSKDRWLFQKIKVVDMLYYW